MHQDTAVPSHTRVRTWPHMPAHAQQTVLSTQTIHKVVADFSFSTAPGESGRDNTELGVTQMKMQMLRFLEVQPCTIPEA